MKKKVFSLLVTFAMLFSMLPTTALAAEPNMDSDVIEVDASNAQDVLDGRYGDITGKTIHFTANIDVVLDLARPTKYEGSETVYYNYVNSQLEDEPTEWSEDISSVMNSHSHYHRTLENVTFTAEEGVSVAGFTFSAGHVASSGYDYVRDVEQTAGVTYYKHSSLDNISFEGLTITGQFVAQLYMADCTVEDITFNGCTFTGATGATDDGSNAAVKFQADNQYFTDITVEDCDISGYFQGVYIQGVDGAQIVNNTISRTDHNAIALQSHDVAAKGTIDVAENYIFDVRDRAIRLNAVSGDAEISVNNNIMVDCGDENYQLIKAGDVDEEATIDLESNYWDGKGVATAVSGLTAPSTVGITGGTWDGDVSDYLAEGYEVDESGEVVVDESAFAAKVGTKYFNDLQDAIDNAKDGDTITLLADAEIAELITVTGDVTIDGDGCTITWADDYSDTLFNVAEGDSLTMESVTIDGENNFTFYEDTTTVEDGQNWYTRFVNVGEEDKAVNADVIVNAGNLTLGEGTKIQNVTVASTGDNGKTANTETGGFYLMYNDDLALIKSNGGKVILDGAAITGNAGLILNAINAETTMNDANIDGNMGAGNKGGIIIANDGTMSITDTSICNNKAMARSATILGVINGAEVTFNAASKMENNKHIGVGSNTAGAMVVLEGASQFVMNGGSISNNVGGRAGAIASRWVGGNYGQHVEDSFVLDAGTIIGNTAVNASWSDANIFLRSPTTIEEGMTIDGVIAVNAAPGELDITGGQFTGGLSVAEGLYVSITGGVFSYDPSAWVAEGYTDVPLIDGKYCVVPGESSVPVKPVMLQKADGSTEMMDTLADAVSAVANGDTIFVLADNSEVVTVGKVVSFDLVTAEESTFSGRVSAASGYTVTVDGNTYHFVVYVAPSYSGGGGGGSTTPEKKPAPPIVAPDAPAKMTDTAGHWGKEAIDYVISRGLFAGTSETSFSPNTQMTRAMVWTVLARLDGQDTSGGANWYAQAQTWAAANDISDGTLPQGNVTREQLIAILYRYSGSPEANENLNSFGDAGQISNWASDAMQWAVQNGLIVGSNNALNPQGDATRAEVATILMRYIQLITK